MKLQQSIKSFVLRYGHMSAAQKSAIPRLWPLYGLDLQGNELDFNQIFPRKAPVELEIGFGMGNTLITLAQKFPEKNFIGIDVHKPGVGTLLLQIEKLNITNIKVFCADAIEVLQSIPNESLNSVYLLFPDPWPKRKHHKRRIVQPFFVELMTKKLICGGKFHLATDWEDYAHHMMNTVSENSHLKLDASASEAVDRPITKFEMRGKKLGHSIWDYVFIRV